MSGLLTDCGSPGLPTGARSAGATSTVGSPTPSAPEGGQNGRAKRYRPPTGISFARGPSLRLRFWHSIATDRGTIPKGRWVYVRAYLHTPAHGWFRAQDTGGAVDGRHIDVYRPPPSDPSAGKTLCGRRVWVAPRGSTRSGTRGRSTVPAAESARADGRYWAPNRSRPAVELALSQLS